MATFSCLSLQTKLSLSLALSGEKRIEVYEKNQQWTFVMQSSKAEFTLPIDCVENVGISIYVGDKLVCKGGSEKQIEECENSENNEIEEDKSKEKEIEKTDYNDEEIAEQNFYPSDVKIKYVDGKMDAIMLSNDIYQYIENNENGLFNYVICNKKQEKKQEKEIEEVASTFVESEPTFARKACYYEQIKDKVDELFDKCEREKELENLMPESKWVRVHKDRNKFYVVGIIGNKNGIPDYICYGLPSTFSFIPPSSLGCDARWLPLDVKNPQDKGYWVIFQSARSGDTIKNE